MTLSKRHFIYSLFLIFISGCYQDDLIMPLSFPIQQSAAVEYGCDRLYLNAHDFASGRRLLNTQEATSKDGRTRIIINTYISNTHTINQIGVGKNVNHLSVSVDPDEVLVGGGATTFIYDEDDFNSIRGLLNDDLAYYAYWWRYYLNSSPSRNVQAFISSSYPVDDKSFSTWAADSKGQFDGLEHKHHLKVTAVGMKVYYDGRLIPSATLKSNMDISIKEAPVKNLSDDSQIFFSEPLSSKWVLLATGIKSCWTEEGDGWFLGNLQVEQNNSKQEGFLAKALLVREQNTSIDTKATSTFYCLSFRNINPIDDSRKLFKHTFSEDHTVDNENFEGLLQRVRTVPINWNDDLVISAFGGMWPGYDNGTKYLNAQTWAISSLTPLGWISCMEAASELVTKYRFSGVDPKSYGRPPALRSLSLLSITPN